MAVPTLSYREVARIFRRGGAQFVRQRGSHRTWERNVNGSPRPVEIVAHQDGDDVLSCYIVRARKAWMLKAQDGVSDKDFYEGNWPPR